jgi:hydroxymethylbilane synthase
MLMRIRPDLKVSSIRGNVDTRLKKLHDGDYDAIILAKAGLFRLGLEDSITAVLGIDDFLPAPGQGALAIQVRAGDSETLGLIGSIDDPDSHRCLDIERLFMRRLGIGCSAAVGGMAFFEEGRFHLKTSILDRDGTARIGASHNIQPGRSDESLVDEVTKRLIAEGARSLIERSNEPEK